jgi:DNA-directed RNA polymerase subunit RPC12/RpoP
MSELEYWYVCINCGHVQHASAPIDCGQCGSSSVVLATDETYNDEDEVF